MPWIKKLVYCSSTGAIPELPKGTPIKEVDYFDESKMLGGIDVLIDGGASTGKKFKK